MTVLPTQPVPSKYTSWPTEYLCIIGREAVAWAQGFLSGTNSHAIANKGTVRDLSSMSIKQQQQFLRDYCDKHPLADYMAGVLDLYLQFKRSDSRAGK